MLIFYKAIDQSVLSAGFAIPILHKEQLFSELGFTLKRGEQKVIEILLEGIVYEAMLTNIQFDICKYPNHADMLQVRYGAKSPLARRLQQIFAHTKNLISQNYAFHGTRRITALPETQKEYMAVYSTTMSGVLSLECISNDEFLEETKTLAELGEKAAESILDDTDDNAAIYLRTKLVKVRKLTKQIILNLKSIYGYRCQICGQCIGEPYGAKLIHAHHIDYFTKSFNNNTSNILIVCPNHHGIIHELNPVFNRQTKEFYYPNGYVDKLIVNYHL